MVQKTEASQAVAPWPDYNGNAIHHGDRLVHPDGNTFVAIKLEGYDDVSDAWRAIYDYDPSHLSRLILEIGNKGRAALKAQPAHDHQELTTMGVDLQITQDLNIKAQLATTKAPKGSQIGWVNTKYGNFIPLSGLASTKRNSELLASRELIAVYGAGQLSGNSGELQPSGNTGELAEGEDSARLIAMLVDRDTPPDNRRDVIDHDIRGNPITREMVARASAETGGVKP